MPFVEGETLRDRLNREKQLPVDESLEITKAVASALEYAHRQDVIHRDVKPENILMHEGFAMVADFGIALAVRAAGGERLTETGLSLGTPAYMSPEQVAGDRDIDGRSDTYSLACVLYEMLAGDPPFVATNPQAVLARHVTDPAPPITTVRSSVPQPVAAAIAKALGKARADRYEEATDFADALFAEAAEAEPDIKSIVVLPFDNLSPDPDQEYFSDGLTEEVISDLSKLKSLRVISRSSAMTFKGSDKRIPEIAQELDVRYALEGSVRKAGNSLRVSVQLIDADADAHLWSEKYTGTLDDVFDVQEEVSRSIVETLNVELSGEESKVLAERPIPNLMAYEHYLKARSEIYGFDKASLERASQRLEQGLAIVGENALLLRGLGLVHFQMLNTGSSEDESHIDGLDRCADRLKNIDPADPGGFLLSGLANVLKANGRQAVLDLYQSYQRDSSDPDTLVFLAVGMLATGQPERSSRISDEAVRIDPMGPINHLLVGYTAFFQGRFEDMIAPLRRGLELGTDIPVSLWCAVRLYAAAGLTDEALAASARLQDLHYDTPFAESVRIFIAAFEGRDEDVCEPSEGLRAWAARDCEWGQFLVDVYALAGLEDKAIEWLEICTKVGFMNTPFLREHDPFLDSIRGSARFEEIMHRVQREKAEFEAKLDAAVGPS